MSSRTRESFGPTTSSRMLGRVSSTYVEHASRAGMITLEQAWFNPLNDEIIVAADREGDQVRRLSGVELGRDPVLPVPTSLNRVAGTGTGTTDVARVG